MTSDMAAHHEANVALVRERVGMGDAPQVPRPLDHLVRVPRKHADAAQAALVEVGFRIDGVERGLRRARIEFSRIDAADVETADACTQQILDLVGPLGGDYDGWSGFLARNPAEGGAPT